jgi:putative hydrolase of the HAD superfamily
LGISKEEFSVPYFKYNHLSNLKDMSSLEFWTTVFSDLGRENEAQGFVEFLNNAAPGEINTEILVLIELLEKKGYKIGLLSNNTSSGAAEARAVGVDDVFKVALFSAEVGCMKPHKEAFELLATKLEVNVSDMIFVDDSPKSLEKASEIGYTPILYKNMPEFLDELKKLGIVTADEIENITHNTTYERL